MNHSQISQNVTLIHDSNISIVNDSFQYKIQIP